MTETHKEMERLKELLAKVAPGDWSLMEQERHGDRCVSYELEVWNEDNDVLVATEVRRAHKDGGRDALELIVQTHNLLPALLSAYAGMKEENARLLTALGRVQEIRLSISRQQSPTADEMEMYRALGAALAVLPTGEAEKPICWAQQNGLADDVERIANTVGSAGHPNEAHELATIAYLMRTPKTAPGVSALQEENARLREALAQAVDMLKSVSVMEDEDLPCEDGQSAWDKDIARFEVALSQKEEGEAS